MRRRFAVCRSGEGLELTTPRAAVSHVVPAPAPHQVILRDDLACQGVVASLLAVDHVVVLEDDRLIVRVLLAHLHRGKPDGVRYRPPALRP